MHNPGRCNACGRLSEVTVACSAYGPISFAYCPDCLRKCLEPYGAVVSFIACAGHFPEDISEAYRQDVRRMLPLWGKTEKAFIQDVEREIQEIEEAMKCQP